MRHGETGWRNQNGMSLIETMLVVVLIGIVTLIGTHGIDFYQRYELQSATRQIFGTIEKVRQDAMTKRTTVDPASLVVVTSRGFGIRLIGTNTGYTGYATFEFNDIDKDFKYDGTLEEYAPTGTIAFPRSVIVTSTVDNVLLYDERGLSRDKDGAAGWRTYSLKNSNITTQCVTVGTIRIVEAC